MKSINYLLLGCCGLMFACASVPPIELVNAREAYKQASSGQAAQLVPAEVHKASVALELAEKSFQSDPESWHTRDLAYIADRKAKLAEALAVTAAENTATVDANNEYDATQAGIVKQTRADLAAAEQTAAMKNRQLATEQKARQDAEVKAADQKADANMTAMRVKQSTDAEAARVKAASDSTAMRAKEATDAEARRVKQASDAEARRLNEAILVLEKGKRVVLRGITFESNRSTLRPESDKVLTQAYNALVSNPDVQIEISGHTDDVGSQESNQKLSLERAQAVRTWLIQKGIVSNRMKTVGKGENEPVSSNGTTAGRAENRRIEFFVQQ